MNRLTQIEANVILNLLSSNSIEASLKGTRDYVTIFMGLQTGSYRIEVNESDLEAAQELLKSMDKKSPSELPQELQESTLKTTPLNSKQLIKRALVLNLLGLLLVPIVLNIFSLRPFIGYLKTEPLSFKKISWSMIYFATLATCIIIWYNIIKNLI